MAPGAGFPRLWAAARRRCDGVIEARRRRWVRRDANGERGGERRVEARGQAFWPGLLTLLGASVLIFVGHRDSAGRPRLGDPAKQCDAGEPRSAAPRTRARPAGDRPLSPNGCSAHCAAISATRSPMARDVLTEIAPRFANTMFLAAYAAFVSVPAGGRPGRLGGDPAGRRVRRLVNLVTLMTISVPEYFLAYILIKYRRGRSRLVSLARQRDAGHGVRRPPLSRRSCRW